MAESDNVRAAAVTVASYGLFAINDAIMKMVMLKVTQMQTIFVRGLFVVPLLALLAPLGVVERRSEARRVVRCPHCQRCSSMDCVFLVSVISLRCEFCGGASEARFRWKARAAFDLSADIESVRVIA